MVAPAFAPPPDAPPAIVRELRRWHAADQLCRADPSASASCDARTSDVAALYRKGWCYGDPKKIETDATWARCGSVARPAPRKLPPGDSLDYDPQLALHRQMAETMEATYVSVARTCTENQVTLYLRMGVQSRRELAERVTAFCERYYAQSSSFGGKMAHPAAVAAAYNEIARQAPAGQR